MTPEQAKLSNDIFAALERGEKPNLEDAKKLYIASKNAGDDIFRKDFIKKAEQLNDEELFNLASVFMEAHRDVDKSNVPMRSNNAVLSANLYNALSKRHKYNVNHPHLKEMHQLILAHIKEINDPKIQENTIAAASNVIAANHFMNINTQLLDAVEESKESDIAKNQQALTEFMKNSKTWIANQSKSINQTLQPNLPMRATLFSLQNLDKNTLEKHQAARTCPPEVDAFLETLTQDFKLILPEKPDPLQQADNLLAALGNCLRTNPEAFYQASLDKLMLIHDVYEGSLREEKSGEKMYLLSELYSGIDTTKRSLEKLENPKKYEKPDATIHLKEDKIIPSMRKATPIQQRYIIAEMAGIERKFKHGVVRGDKNAVTELLKDVSEFDKKYYAENHNPADYEKNGFGKDRFHMDTIQILVDKIKEKHSTNDYQATNRTSTFNVLKKLVGKFFRPSKKEETAPKIAKEEVRKSQQLPGITPLERKSNTVSEPLNAEERKSFRK